MTYPLQYSNLNPKIEVTNPLKLHLGCGKTLLKGWVNLDVREPPFKVPEDTKFFKADVRDLHLPNDRVDEMLVIHLLEHFTMPEHDRLLWSWWSALKNGGRIRLVGPNFDQMIKDYVNNMTEFGKNVRQELWDIFQVVMFDLGPAPGTPGHQSLLTPWYVKHLFSRTLYEPVKVFTQPMGWGLAVEAFKKIDPCGSICRNTNAKIEDDEELKKLWPADWKEEVC